MVLLRDEGECSLYKGIETKIRAAGQADWQYLPLSLFKYSQ